MSESRRALRMRGLPALWGPLGSRPRACCPTPPINLPPTGAPAELLTAQVASTSGAGLRPRRHRYRGQAPLRASWRDLGRGASRIRRTHAHYTAPRHRPLCTLLYFSICTPPHSLPSAFESCRGACRTGRAAPPQRGRDRPKRHLSELAIILTMQGRRNREM